MRFIQFSVLVMVLLLANASVALASYNRANTPPLEEEKKEYAHPKQQAALESEPVRKIEPTDIITLEKASNLLRGTHPKVASQIDAIIDRLVQG